VAVCAPVERESLLSNFLEMPGELVDDLRTIIVGPDYASRKHDVESSTNLVGAYDETAGTSSAWPNLQSDETVDLTTAKVFIANALVNYYADTAPAPGATEGAQSGTTPSAIIHDSGNTIWTGSSFTPALNIPVEVGDYVKLDDEGGNVLETRVAGFDSSGSDPDILILEDNLPTALTGGANFNVILAEIVDEIELDSTDVTLAASTVQADAGITASTDRTGSTSYPVIGGTDFSDVFTDYRAIRDTNENTVISVREPSELGSFFVGYENPDSELGFAVARALAPVTDPPTSNPPAVLFIALQSDDLAGYQEAFSRIRNRRDWYIVAPLTEDISVIGELTTLLSQRSLLDLTSHGMVSQSLTLETILVSGAGNTVNVDDSLTSGEDRTVTRDGGITDPFADAIAGDIVQIAGTDFTIESVVSNQTVIITSPTTSGPGQTLNNVRHPLSFEEQAEDYGQRASAFMNRNLSVIFPPDPQWNGEVVEGYLFAAATAGIRGYTMPHQSIVGTLFESGWSVPQSAGEFLPFLDDLAADGVFVIEECESLPGNAVIRDGNNTDQSSTIASKESLTANSDAVRRFYRGRLGAFSGKNKITVALINTLRAEAIGAGEFLMTSTRVKPFGSVIIEHVVGALTQDPVNITKLIIPITVTITPSLEDVDVSITILTEFATAVV